MKPMAGIKGPKLKDGILVRENIADFVAPNTQNSDKSKNSGSKPHKGHYFCNESEIFGNYFERNMALERKLGTAFSHAFSEAAHGEAASSAIVDLTEKVKKIIRTVPDETFKKDLLVNEVLRFVNLLHDNFAFKDVQKNPEILRNYSEMLLGKKETEYSFVSSDKKVETKVKYLKY